MLDVGVPRDWVTVVRDTAQASVMALCASLPDEAAEALLDHATGARLADHVAVRAVPGAGHADDPWAHPDAQRRFRTLENVEELRAALDQPFATWAVFLHPRQRAPVERRWTGPARVSGSADAIRGRAGIGIPGRLRGMARPLLDKTAGQLGPAIRMPLAVNPTAISSCSLRRPCAGLATRRSIRSESRGFASTSACVTSMPPFARSLAATGLTSRPEVTGGKFKRSQRVIAVWFPEFASNG